MPEFKKYSGIKACEDFTQRIDLASSGVTTVTVRPYKTAAGVEANQLTQNGSATYGGKNLKYLSADSILASGDDYDPADYYGTSTGTCTFTKTASTSGIMYAISFTANESATVKCFKFFKLLSGQIPGGSVTNNNVLMFAVYFDTPITVTAGDVLNMSINFAYDEVTVI
jgi:hypothetical protein